MIAAKSKRCIRCTEPIASFRPVSLFFSAWNPLGRLHRALGGSETGSGSRLAAGPSGNSTRTDFEGCYTRPEVARCVSVCLGRAAVVARESRH